jgi:hypothetical protein
MAVDYSTLVAAETTVGSIKYAINYSRIDAAGILTEAQAWIYTRLRVREMISTANVAIADEATTASLPTGFLDPIQFGIPGHMPRIKFKDAETFRAELGWDEDAALPEGPPTRWTVIDETIQFDHKADQAYTAKLAYFKTPTALSASNETNWLTSRYPTLIRRVCTMFAAEARKEYDLMDRSEIKALELIQEIRKESDLIYRGMEADFNWEHSD